jgi:leucyl-tRNA synthetase
MRLCILFIAPPEKDFDWDPNAVEGANRFLRRAWRIVWLLSRTADAKATVDLSQLKAHAAELNHTLHAMGLKCTADFGRCQFNTAISSIMELTNAASKYLNETTSDTRDQGLCWQVAYDIVAMLSPIVPHWSEELFHEALGSTSSIYDEPWPTFDAAQATRDTIRIAVQVKGKVRAHVDVSSEASTDELKSAALSAVARQIEGKQVKKIIVVPGRLVNIVAV